MIDVDQIRIRQEQRLTPVLQALNEAKQHLANAIALVETRERQYREIQDDVKRKLDALALVISMAAEPAVQIPQTPMPQAQIPPANPKVEEPAVRMLPESAQLEDRKQELEKSVIAAPASKDSKQSDGMFRRSSRPLFPQRNPTPATLTPAAPATSSATSLVTSKASRTSILHLD
jgi:hypothetical protein